jgi:hypothetical protein
LKKFYNFSNNILLITLIFINNLISADLYAQHDIPPSIKNATKFTQWINNYDRKNVFQIPFDPYQDNSPKLENNEALSRIKKFTSTLFEDYFKKKYKVIKGVRITGNHLTEVNNNSFNIINDVKYSLKGRKMQIAILGQYFNLSGVLYFDGHGEIKIYKYLSAHNLDTEYKYSIKEELHTIIMKKYFTNQFSLMASIIKDNSYQKDYDQTDKFIELLYTTKL